MKIRCLVFITLQFFLPVSSWCFVGEEKAFLDFCLTVTKEVRAGTFDLVTEKEKRVNDVSIAAENVSITSGVSEGIRMVISALIEKGDEI